MNPDLYTLLRNAFFAPEHNNCTIDAPCRFQSVLLALNHPMATDFFNRRIHQEALQKLCTVFKLPENVISLSIDIPSDGLAELTVARVLTSEELQAFADWAESEGVQVDEIETSSETLYTPDPSNA